jgi:hypothetical protein
MVAFSIFRDSYYVENMGLFLLMLEYHKANGLPLLAVLQKNWAHMNGEDIELVNRSLSKATKSTSGQSNSEFLNRSIRLIGAMRENNSHLISEIDKYRSLQGFRGSKRLKYKVGDEVVTRAEEWLSKMINDMRTGSWKHYKINYGSLGGKRKLVGGKMRKKVSTKQVEEKSLSLEQVDQLDTRDWEQFLQKRLTLVVLRKWNWGTNLDLSECHWKENDDGYIFV